jgi:hypothetical protein
MHASALKPTGLKLVAAAARISQRFGYKILENPAPAAEA